MIIKYNIFIVSIMIFISILIINLKKKHIRANYKVYPIKSIYGILLNDNSNYLIFNWYYNYLFWILNTKK